jgi:hypothetical protein
MSIVVESITVIGDIGCVPSNPTDNANKTKTIAKIGKAIDDIDVWDCVAIVMSFIGLLQSRISMSFYFFVCRDMACFMTSFVPAAGVGVRTCSHRIVALVC